MKFSFRGEPYFVGDHDGSFYVMDRRNFERMLANIAFGDQSSLFVGCKYAVVERVEVNAITKEKAAAMLGELLAKRSSLARAILKASKA